MTKRQTIESRYLAGKSDRRFCCNGFTAIEKPLLDHLRFIEDHHAAIFKLKPSFQFFGEGHNPNQLSHN
jgi:hypothetical protein